MMVLIPKSVSINGKTVADEDYLNMLTNIIVKISEGNSEYYSISIILSNLSVTSGVTITKSKCVAMAKILIVSILMSIFNFSIYLYLIFLYIYI